MGTGKAVESDLNFEYKPGVLAIHNSSKPWIALINGPCAGIAYSYAMACDLACMGDSAYLYQPFSAIGLVPDGGATWLIPRLVGTKRAYELMALGEKLSSSKALAMGMVNRVFPDASLRDDGIAYAREVAERSPLALSYTKAAVNFGQTHSLDATISKEAELQALCIDSEDAKNAVIAFFNKEKPQWQGR
jgi:2-(1,2-epoxy-1,2-dihydrophenyl)acetyl-CoA isomerase